MLFFALYAIGFVVAFFVTYLRLSDNGMVNTFQEKVFGVIFCSIAGALWFGYIFILLIKFIDTVFNNKLPTEIK